MDKKETSKNKRKVIAIMAALFLLIIVIIVIGYQYLKPGLEKTKLNPATDTTIQGSNDKGKALSGGGSKEVPYQITSMEEFMQFVNMVNEGNTFAGQYVQLATDLDFASVDSDALIGNADETVNFSGVFDGAAHKVQNLSLSSGDVTGLFVNLDGVVCNLLIESGNIQGNVAGAIAGSMTANAAILNCYNKACVSGETAGGIAGIGNGTIINCVNMATEDMGSTESIVGNKEEVVIQNCYTNKGGNFEIENHTSAEADAKIRGTAVSNLNTMLTALTMKYGVDDWYKWKLTENEPIIVQTAANTITGATLETAGTVIEAQYSDVEHAWVFEIPEDAAEQRDITLQCKDGSSKQITCEATYSILHYMNEDIDTTMNFKQGDLFISQELVPGISDEENPIYLDVNTFIATPESTGANVYHTVYMDKEGEVTDTDDLVVITQPGTYRVTGTLNGQLAVDMGSDAATNGNAQATIILDGVHIDSSYGPAITVKNILETGDIENPGIRIKLADGSENEVIGSNSMDIYSAKGKSEGAISTVATMSIGGTDGQINVIGDLEGIESNERLAINGGGYHITSSDDGINTSEELRINDGYLVMNANDDVFDSNGEITIKNGTIIGYTPTEHVFNAKDGTKVDGGFIIGSSSYSNDCKEGSKQGLIELKSEQLFTKGQRIVMTDAEDNAILAFEVQADGNSIVISMEEMQDKTFHFYESTQVQGTFTDGVCTEVTGYIADTEITYDGAEKE